MPLRIAPVDSHCLR